MSIRSALLALFFACLFACGLNPPQGNQDGNSLNQISNLNVGDAQVLQFFNGRAQIEFMDENPNQHYLLAISGGLSGMSLAIEGGSTTPETSQETPQPEPSASPAAISPSFDPNPGQADHDWFRQQERENVFLGSLPSTTSQEMLALAATQNFKVLSNSNASYTSISASLIGSASRINIYLDTATSQNLSASLTTELTQTLNNLSGDLINLFGSPSDINGNGRVDIVLTPTLENFGNNNPLSGYFWAGDLQPLALQQASNEREVIFLIAPELGSFYGGTVPAQEVMQRILPGVFVHEFQHLLNYLNKYSPEDPTINESLSHAMENYFGYPHELRYKQQDCLENIENVNLGNSNTDLATRGCGGLLFQHICEQAGTSSACLASIINSPNSGWVNVAQAVGEDMGILVAKYLAGLILTGNPMGSTSSYQFQPLDVGPAGDMTGFSGYTAYNDYRHTTLQGPSMNETPINLPFQSTSSGFAKIVHITSASALNLLVTSATPDGLYGQGGSAVLIRIPGEEI